MLSVGAAGYAQYAKVYDNEVSLRGYDIVENNGNYYYSCGNDEANITFQIDPANGSIISPLSHIGKLPDAGSQTGTAKNSILIHDAGTGNAADNPLVVSGFNPVYGSWPDPTLLSYHIKDVGSSFNQTSQDLWRWDPFIHPNGNREYVSYADQTFVTNNGTQRYFTGLRKAYGTTSSNRALTPYVLNESQSFVTYLKPFTGMNHEMVPTRIIESETGKAFVSYGAIMSNGNNWINNSVRRNAGIMGLGSNMWIEWSNTYHNGDLFDNLGAAQSVIHSGFGPHQYYHFVASGNNPMDPSQDEFGNWDKDYFHVVRLNSNGSVNRAKKITLKAVIQDLELGVTFERTQVSDIVDDRGHYYVTGTTTRVEHYEQYSIMEEVVFVVKLDGFLNLMDMRFFTFNHAPQGQLSSFHVNRIKLINDELYIAGSLLDQGDEVKRKPFIINVTKDMDLQCGAELDADIESVTLTVVGLPFSTDRSDAGSAAGNNDLVEADMNEVQTCVDQVFVCQDPDLVYVEPCCILSVAGDICIAHNVNYSIDIYKNSVLVLSTTGQGQLGTCFGNQIPGGVFAGQYDIYITDVNGCQFTLNQSIGCIPSCKGGESQSLEMNSHASTQVFPNPAQGLLNINFHEETAGSFHILDLSGKVVLSQEFQASSSAQLSIESLPVGIYTLQIIGQDLNEVHRIVKQ